MDVAGLLAQGKKLFSYAKDELIYETGALPVYVYFINSGKVKMVTRNANGDPFIQGVFEAGAYFGEPALVLDKAYLADTIAMGPVTLFKVSRQEFLKAIEDDSGFSLKIIREMSERLFYKSMMLEELANENAAHILLKLIDYLMLDVLSGSKLKVTRKELAEMTGLRIETVIRTLKLLAKQQKIRLEGGKIYKHQL